MPLRLLRPLHYAFPPAWQTRVAEIDHLLGAGGAFADEFRELRELEPEWQRTGRLKEVVGRWLDLLPGEAGYKLARAILDGSPPVRFRCNGETGWKYVDVFTDPIPPFRADFSRGGTNVFASRRARSDRTNRLLDLLRGGVGRRPLTHRETALQLRMNGSEFQREVSRLRRRRGIPIRSSQEQKHVVGVFTRWRSELRRVTARRGKVEYVNVPVGFASLCTGHAVAELTSLGIQRLKTNKNEFDVMLDVVQVPRGLLLQATPRQPLEIVQFLESLVN